MRRTAGPWLAAVSFCALVILPTGLSPFAVRIGQLMAYSAGLGLAWNILGGLAGYRSFGHAAFIGIGAFAAGLLEAQLPDMAPLPRLFIGLAAAAVACGLISLLLAYPLLRLRGAYFAIAMLGVSHVAGELNTNIDVLGGAMGVMFASASPEGWDTQVFYYELCLFAAGFILLISYVLRRSRLGYGLRSIREDEDTARMLAVPTERYKMAAFVLSAVPTGVLGAIYAHSLGYVTASSLYRDDTNLSLVVFAMLGGIHTLTGPVIGAVLLTFLTYVALSDYPNVHLFVTGLVLVTLVLVAPGGLLGLARRMSARSRPAHAL